MAEPGAGFYPQQVPIDAYGNGGFRFAGLSHRGSLLCLPNGMQAWDATLPEQVTIDSLARVFEVAEQLDVLLIGLGGDIARLDPAVRAALKQHGVIVEAIATGGAVRTYNVLLAEDRAVGAALLAVENAR